MYLCDSTIYLVFAPRRGEVSFSDDGACFTQGTDSRVAGVYLLLGSLTSAPVAFPTPPSRRVFFHATELHLRNSVRADLYADDRRHSRRPSPVCQEEAYRLREV